MVKPSMRNPTFSSERKNFKKLFSYLRHLVLWQALFLKAETIEQFWRFHVVLDYKHLLVRDLDFLDEVDLGTLLELQQILDLCESAINHVITYERPALQVGHCLVTYLFSVIVVSWAEWAGILEPILAVTFWLFADDLNADSTALVSRA